MKALPPLLVLLLVPSASAGFDSYTTAQGARATAAYPDVMNMGDEFFVTINADAGTGQINSFSTAPSGWSFVGCTFVTAEVSQVGSTHKSQTVRLNMTDDSCTFNVKIVWATNLGQQSGVTIVQGSVVTDEQDQNLFAKEFVQPIAWLVWLAYLVLLYKVKQEPLRAVAVLVGFSIVLLPMPKLQGLILLAGQLAVAIIFLVQLIRNKT